MESFIEILNKISDVKERTRHFFTETKHIRTFKSSGLQSKAGVMSYKGLNFVYKMCKYGISNSIQHEYTVTKDIEKINLPTFQRCYGMCVLYVGRDIIDITNKKNKKVLFLHLYERFSLCQFLDFQHTDKMRVSSFILNILMTLYILQISKKFCHHDLHPGNVLLQKCSENKVMCYDLSQNHNSEIYFVPTYGYYPVIIDCGNSYSKGVEGTGMQTHTDKYYKGFRYSLPDKIEDIHHFLLTVFSYLKDDDVNDNGEEFKKLGQRIWLQFRGMSLTPSGWKILKVRITDELIENIYHLKGKKKKKYGIIEKYHARFFEIFNPLVILPFRKNGKTLRESFLLLNGFISILQTIESQTFHNVCEVKGRWYLEQICWYIESLNLTELKNTTGIDFVFPEDFISKSRIYGENLSNIYYLLTEEDNKRVNKWYSNIKIKSSKDMFIFFAKEIITPSFNITSTTTIEQYTLETNTRKEFKLDDEKMLYKINHESFLKKGIILKGL